MDSSYAVDVQRGSRISITEAGVLTLRTGSYPEFRPGRGPSLHLGDKELSVHGYEQVYDLATITTRVVALVEGDTSQNLPFRTIALSTVSLVPLEHWTVSAAVERVAVTSRAVFFADASLVYCYANAQTTKLCERPIDLAATPAQLAVLDARGVSFFDASGGVQGSVRLFAPTAIAVDPIDPGWLVAIDGGVFHLDGPGDTPHLVASCAEPIRKIRRSRDATYVAVDAELRAIHDDRVEVLGRLDDNAWYWNDFDANADGLELLTPLARS